MDGNSFMEMLLGAKANCLNCGNPLTFESAGNLAKANGIKDNVLMCDKCRHIFACTLVPGRLTLDSDVTAKYAEAAGGEAAPEKAVEAVKEEVKEAVRSEAKPEPKPEPRQEGPAPKKGFFAKLFGK